MKLDRKRKLVARTLGVGLNKIIFNPEKLDEIKEAITRQDMKDLVMGKAITIKEKKGRKKAVRRKRKRGIGKIKKKGKAKSRKQRYIKLTRKLRDYIKGLRKLKIIDTEKYYGLRKKIRASEFRSKKHLKESLEAK